MRIGLYFGSFNPIHNGHLIIAQHMMNTGIFDKIRFVISLQNPFKNTTDLLDENLRLNCVKKAIENNENFEASEIEFVLPKPSYTIQTVTAFRTNEPENEFSIILGSDNLEKLNEWKDIEKLLQYCDFHVYKRRGSDEIKPQMQGNFIFHDAPFLDISATYIRGLINAGKSIKYLVPDEVVALMKL
jgi:nicotinate-nucleotide adenylyltransferase